MARGIWPDDRPATWSKTKVPKPAHIRGGAMRLIKSNQLLLYPFFLREVFLLGGRVAGLESFSRRIGECRVDGYDAARKSEEFARSS